MNIYGLCCTRNEADRYLEECLNWHADFLDDILIYDDQSEDDTRHIAGGAGCIVVERPNSIPTFLNDESAFRYAAWCALERELEPRPGDWVLCFDADEFLVGAPDERAALQHSATTALDDGCNAVTFNVLEVFDETEDGPLVRCDGFWGAITAKRFVRWEPYGRFASKRMGGGSVPSYARAVGVKPNAQFLHYGYARAEDRRSKYERYTALWANGHSSSHIESIITDAKLAPYNGRTPR